MAGKKKPFPLLERIEITGVAAEGKAIARVDDMVVFVPWVAPGDVVDIQLTRKKRNFAEGRAVHFHSLSPHRVEPLCEHFGLCGGCKWQHLRYSEQVKHKQQQVADSLERIGKVAVREFLPIVSAERTECYRNKLEYTFSNRRWLIDGENITPDDIRELYGLGFHIPQKFDKVLDINKCWLQDDISNRIRLYIKEFCLSHEGYPFFDLRKQEGFMRTLIIRTTTTGEVMLVVVFYQDDSKLRKALLDSVKTAFPEITSLMYAVNPKRNDTLNDQTVILYHGLEYLTEAMEGLRFKIGPKSFYQTNSEQACRLYSVVREFAALTGHETVYDLYTGAGTIALFLARQAQKIVGIEYVEDAVADARVNAQLNNIANASFVAGDMKDVLNSDFIDEHGRPDVIITDPPRAGMHTDVINAILAAAPRRIVYVSCNPASQARDLNLLSVAYDTDKVCPVDMFPHTHHVENVALLIRKTRLIDLL